MNWECVCELNITELVYFTGKKNFIWQRADIWDEASVLLALHRYSEQSTLFITGSVELLLNEFRGAVINYFIMKL